MSSHIITASEIDLLAFFEVEPQPRDAEPWPYNDFLYETRRGEFQVSFAVAPAYKDVRFILSWKGRVIYELNAVGVDDVRYEKDRIGERLDVVVSSRETVSFRLQPEVSIDHHISDGLGRTRGP